MNEKYEIKREAENMYATAMVLKGRGDLQGAKPYAEKSAKFYDKLDIQTLEEAAPTRMRTQGIELPDIMHSGVVRERFGISKVEKSEVEKNSEVSEQKLEKKSNETDKAKNRDSSSYWSSSYWRRGEDLSGYSRREEHRPVYGVDYEHDDHS